MLGNFQVSLLLRCLRKHFTSKYAKKLDDGENHRDCMKSHSNLKRETSLTKMTLSTYDCKARTFQVWNYEKFLKVNFQSEILKGNSVANMAQWKRERNGFLTTKNGKSYFLFALAVYFFSVRIEELSRY